MPAADPHWRGLRTGQGDVAACRIHGNGAAQHLSGAGNVKLGLGRDRQIEAFQCQQMRERNRQRSRNEPLHGQLQLEGLLPHVLVAAEDQLPGAVWGFDLRPPDDRAAAAAVGEVDVKLRHLPDRLAVPVIDDDRCRPQT